MTAFEPGYAMSLRYQILLRILLSSLCILLLGGAIAIWQARHAVAKEVDASVHLALELVSLGISGVSSALQTDDLARFGSLRQTRHLSIQLQKADGQLIHFAGEKRSFDLENMPPAWFIHWVKTDYPEVVHQIKTQDGNTLQLLIKAQPLDEIIEVWQESLGFFSSLSLLTLLTFVVIHLVLNKSLNAISDINEALRIIETGQYKHRLPTFSTQEFDSIAKAVNHMSAELEKTRQENRALTQHSLAIQEEERQRLSQELHDEFGQSLTGIKVMAVAAARQYAEVGKITGTIAEICDHLMLVVRSMTQQLHPLVLTELGLKATLEDMVHRWSERNPDLQLCIQCSDAIDRLDKNITRQIFRVIQECLTNVVRHARARNVSIDLHVVKDQTLSFSVIDDGDGCDLQTMNRGFGLRGIEERIKSMEGEMTLHSRPGKGLKVSAWIPLS